MKKLLSIVLAIAMIASIASVSAFAADLNKIYIKAQSVEFQTGATTVDVPIVVEYAGDKGLLGLVFTVSGEGGATLTKVTKGANLPGYNEIGSIKNGESVVCMVFGADKDSSVASGTTVAIATFEIPADANEDSTYSAVIVSSDDPANFCDIELNNQEGVGVNGTIKSGSMPGDVNGDKSLDAKDIILIMRYIVAKNVKPIPQFNEAAADFNGDKSVDAKDIILIMRQIIKNSTSK